jgi:hypothetical protein
MKALVSLLVFFALSFSASAQRSHEDATQRNHDDGGQRSRLDSAEACWACIQAHEDFLASDILGGRGSGTDDELVAAEYVASELMQYGVRPAIDGNGDPSAGRAGRFIQRVEGSIKNKQGETVKVTTRNVIGILRGSDPKLWNEVILLSAHLDHLGTVPGAPTKNPGDDIYNGADDDASGVTAVLELARVLGSGPKPKRTVIFALFGSEELGGVGSGYFLQHPPVPLSRIVANLEFEMIGRPDPAVGTDALWLTGYERTNLGPELAKHGAHLVADPHPEQKFFTRSDNYILAKRGIVAQTVSSYGLYEEYHTPQDDIAHIDFGHLRNGINSMIEPVRWLVNSDFTPEWRPGQKPN